MVLMSPTNRRNRTTKNPDTAMSAARKAHLQRVLKQFNAGARAKYENGQREHGGNLWQKPGMLEQAIDEAIDLVIYLLTLREQCSGARSATKKTSRGASRSSRKTSAG